mmetsp:Transcript_22732/g.71194  ORF Transcript_22732/g.71194 Transcript_22732/m.71194 type:complete len:108 (+) Transcript_22732:1202-1525(+)
MYSTSSFAIATSGLPTSLSGSRLAALGGELATSLPGYSQQRAAQQAPTDRSSKVLSLARRLLGRLLGQLSATPMLTSDWSIWWRHSNDVLLVGSPPPRAEGCVRLRS